MSYVNLIPSIIEYSEKFSKLDSLDFRIIKTMYENDVRNISRIARITKIPQQTMNNRVNRFDKKDLVRFRSILNETALGLKSFLVIASCGLGKEESSGRAMTCFPLWRYLATIGGDVHGNYVTYVIPPEREIDLTAFLDELVRRKIIHEFEIHSTTGPIHPLPDLDFYQSGRGTPIFDWGKWVENLDSFTEEKFQEPNNYDRADFDLNDLLILRCLEINARMRNKEIVKEMARILKLREYGRLVPLVSRRMKRNITPQQLTRGCRVYILPGTAQNLIFLIYCLSFSNGSALRKFSSGLRLLPYNTTIQKVLQKNELFIHLAIPSYEYPGWRKALAKLGEKGQIRRLRCFLGDLANATWGNVELHQMYRNNAWDFSFGIAINMLKGI